MIKIILIAEGEEAMVTEQIWYQNHHQNTEEESFTDNSYSHRCQWQKLPMSEV